MEAKVKKYCAERFVKSWLLLSYLVFFSSGCAQHKLLAVDSQPYRLRINGVVVEAHAIAVCTLHPPLPAPCLTRIFLSDASLKQNDKDLVRNLITEDDDLDLHYIVFDKVMDCTKDIPRDRIRWLIGLRPVIIAVGRSEQDYRFEVGASLSRNHHVDLGGHIRLVTGNDLHEAASKIICVESPLILDSGGANSFTLDTLFNSSTLGGAKTTGRH